MPEWEAFHFRKFLKISTSSVSQKGQHFGVLLE